MRPRRLAVFGLTAGLLGGGAAGLLATGTTLASAQVSDVTGTVTDPAATTDSTTASDSSTTDSTAADSGSTTTTEAPAATSSDSSTTTTAPAAAPAPAADGSAAAKPAKGDWAKSALAPLVADGTITQAQADKIIAALDAARPAKGPGGKGGRGSRHGFGNLSAAASALGMSEADLRAALEGGKSLAAVAQEKGIAVSKVVDALVAELKAHLDEHVASGKNTQAEADQMLADARTRIEAFVNGTAPAGGPGFGGPGGRHGRGPGAPAASGSSSGTTTS